uniref:DUF7153 domain-containing protein n=1 Tax=Strigamia maritima TaxID=126957 RepID=T1JIG2_STRMM
MAARSSRRNALGKPLSFSMSVFSFVTPSKVQRISYQNCKKQLSEALQSHSHFEDGFLLQTMEKGVLYPIIHMMPCYDLIDDCNLLQADALGNDFVLHQGLYKQIRQIGTDEAIVNVKLENSAVYSTDAVSTFILIGYKGLKCCLQDVLEDTWKDWTGARYLYLNIPSSFTIGRIVLYRRVIPSDVTLFTYILLTECANVQQTKQSCLLDFIQRFRAQRMQGFLSVYQKGCADPSLDSPSESRSATSCSNGSREMHSSSFKLWDI